MTQGILKNMDTGLLTKETLQKKAEELLVSARVCHLKKKKEFLKRIDKRFQGLFLFNFLKVPNSSYGMVL